MNSELDIEQKAFADRIGMLIDTCGGNSDFARKCGFSEGVVRSWRNGGSDPSRKRIAVISHVMNVSMDWLTTGEGPMRKSDSVTEPPNGYYAPRAPSSPDPDAYCYVPLYDVYASAGHGSQIDQEPIIDQLAFKKDWLMGEMGLNPVNCCMIHVTGDSMEPTLHKKDVVMLDRSHTIYMEDGIYCLRLDGGLLVKRLQRINANQVEVISDNSVYRPYQLDTADIQIIGRVVWAGKRF